MLCESVTSSVSVSPWPSGVRPATLRRLSTTVKATGFGPTASTTFVTLPGSRSLKLPSLARRSAPPAARQIRLVLVVAFGKPEDVDRESGDRGGRQGVPWGRALEAVAEDERRAGGVEIRERELDPLVALVEPVQRRHRDRPGVHQAAVGLDVIEVELARRVDDVVEVDLEHAVVPRHARLDERRRLRVVQAHADVDVVARLAGDRVDVGLDLVGGERLRKVPGDVQVEVAVAGTHRMHAAVEHAQRLALLHGGGFRAEGVGTHAPADLEKRGGGVTEA